MPDLLMLGHWLERLTALVTLPMLAVLFVLMWRMYRTERARQILRETHRRRITDQRAPQDIVRMTREELERLPVYNEAMPTGIEVGTRWVRNVRWRDIREEWWLATAVPGFEPQSIELDWARIEIRE